MLIAECKPFLRRDHFFSRALKQIAMDGDKAFLPQDIIINILKRLPVKSLLRFQAVCKDWKNLFKTPSFIADHLHHANHKSSFLLLQGPHRESSHLQLCLVDCEREVLEVRNTPLIYSLSCASVVGSCNGLLCVRDVGTYPHLLFLWNPATREMKQVPITVNDFKGAYGIGFGFSHIVNDYKIVTIEENGNRAQVYSLSKGSWKEVEYGIQRVILKFKTVIVNGAMFWLGLKMGWPNEGDPDLVVSFDIAMEMFALIPKPASASEFNYDKHCHELTVYENKLAMFSHYMMGYSQSFIDLWVMEEGIGASGESWSWTKKYTILPIPDLLYPYMSRKDIVHIPGTLHPFSIWRNKIVCEDKERHGGAITVLSLINPATNKLKKFTIPMAGYRRTIFNYAESFMPVDNIHI